MTTAIEWAANPDGTPGETWNPVVGCQVVSPGCTNCYAMRMAARLDAMGVAHYAGLTQASRAGPVWRGDVRAAPDHVLGAPLRRRKPTTWFVNSMGDLFAGGVTDAMRDRVWGVMALASQHTFIILTKRPEAMRDYVQDLLAERLLRLFDAVIPHPTGLARLPDLIDFGVFARPLPNVWLGVSAEDQPRAEERLPVLLDTPARLRLVSIEPMLGQIDLTPWLQPYEVLPADPVLGKRRHRRQPSLDWVILGGESGPRARAMHPDWPLPIRDACGVVQVPFFFKQWGASAPVQGSMIPVPRHRLGWVSRDGMTIFDPTDTEFRRMSRDDDRHGVTWWSQIARLGKARTGRQLEGRVHDARPAFGQLA